MCDKPNLSRIPSEVAYLRVTRPLLIHLYCLGVTGSLILFRLWWPRSVCLWCVFFGDVLACSWVGLPAAIRLMLLRKKKKKKKKLLEPSSKPRILNISPKVFFVRTTRNTSAWF